MDEKELKKALQEAEIERAKTRKLATIAFIVMIGVVAVASIGIYKVKQGQTLHNDAVEICDITNENYKDYDKQCCYDVYIETQLPGEVKEGKCYYHDGRENTKLNPTEMIQVDMSQFRNVK